MLDSDMESEKDGVLSGDVRKFDSEIEISRVTSAVRSIPSVAIQPAGAAFKERGAATQLVSDVSTHSLMNLPMNLSISLPSGCMDNY